MYSRNRQDELGHRRFFKDGRQAPDWCIVIIFNLNFVKTFPNTLLVVSRFHDAQTSIVSMAFDDDVKGSFCTIRNLR